MPPHIYLFCYSFIWMFDFALLQRFLSVVMIFHVQTSCLQTIAAAIIKDLLFYITERKVGNMLLFPDRMSLNCFLTHHSQASLWKQLTFFILNRIFNWMSLYLAESLSLPYCILETQMTKFNSSIFLIVKYAFNYLKNSIFNVLV